MTAFRRQHEFGDRDPVTQDIACRVCGFTIRAFECRPRTACLKLGYLKRSEQVAASHVHPLELAR